MAKSPQALLALVALVVVLAAVASNASPVPHDGPHDGEAPAPAATPAAAAAATPAAPPPTPKIVVQAAGHRVEDWGYESARGPAHWGAIKPAYKACGNGKFQSPVNLKANEVVGGGGRPQVRLPVFINLTATHLGHAVQFNVPDSDPLKPRRGLRPPAGAGNYSAGEDAFYVLQQFHVHTPSEHHVAGKFWPAEVHLVHKAPSGALAVLGFFVEEVDRDVPGWAAALRSIPRDPHGASQPLPEFDTAPFTRALARSGGDLFAYRGSLTVPPCTEGVRWWVARAPIPMSARQIAAFASRTGFNSRPTQRNQDVVDRRTPPLAEDTEVAAAPTPAPAANATSMPAAKEAAAAPIDPPAAH